MEFHALQLPLVKESRGLTIDDSFLCAAWCLRLQVSEEIHRFELFGFFQTTIGKQSEQTLQGIIEKSNYWTVQKGTGIYKLKNTGKSRIDKLFKSNPYKFDRYQIYTLSRIVSGTTFSIQLNGKSRESQVFIEGRIVSGTEAKEELLARTNFSRKTSGISFVWNWILQGDYFWESDHQGANYSLTKDEGEGPVKETTKYESTQTDEKGTENPDIYPYEELLNDLGVEDKILKGWLEALDRKKQGIFYGPPGTGKTYAARKIAKYIASNSQGIVEIVQFHPSYAYEDFVQGIRPITRDNGNLEYSIEKGRLLKFCDEANEHSGISVMIIDEINRAELSRVFGELMYLLEYRNENILLASGEKFSFPSNVYFIGTMNTADRSIALVDHALRRRFAFIRLFPDYELLLNFHKDTGFNPEGLIDVLKKVNREIGNMNYSVGPSFFMLPNIQKCIKSIWQMEIEPYLEEYFFDDEDKVDNYRWDNVSALILD